MKDLFRKRPLTKLSVVIVLIVLVAFSTVAFAISKSDFLIQSYTNMSEEKMVSALSEKSFEELVSDINTLTDSVDEADLIFYADALRREAKQISTEKLTNEILNENNTSTLKILLLQIAHLDRIDIDNESLENLLSTDSDFELKRNALITIFTQDPNSKLIETIASGNDDRLAFQAIKMLNTSDPEKALSIANEILRDYSGNNTAKLNAAIKVKAANLAKESTADERLEFISFCGKLLEGKNTKDDLTRDTVIFALSDMLSPESISYIVRSELIDNIAKQYCIDQNYKVLAGMLRNGSNEDKESVILAMQIYPISEMEKEIQTALNDYKQNPSKNVASEEIINGLLDVAEFISENGAPATNKY